MSPVWTRLNITVLEMRWQHAPNPRCRDAETARTITCGPSTWYNHVIVVSRAKPRTKGNGDDRWTDVAEVHWWSAMDAVICHQRNCIVHGTTPYSVAELHFAADLPSMCDVLTIIRQFFVRTAFNTSGCLPHDIGDYHVTALLQTGPGKTNHDFI